MELLSSVLTDALFIAPLIWCGYTDIRKRTVPNAAVILLLCIGVLHTVLMGLSGSTWWMYPAGLALAVPFLIVWIKGGMGAGDVKLLMGIGLYLGLLSTVVAFALMLPAMAVLCVRSWIRNKTLKQRIPFAPVLALGAVGVTAASYLYVLL